jgi:hypothetical protein
MSMEHDVQSFVGGLILSSGDMKGTVALSDRAWSRGRSGPPAENVADA